MKNPKHASGSGKQRKVLDFLFEFCMLLGNSEQGKVQYRWKRKTKKPPLSYSSYQFLKSEACFGAVYEAKQGSGLPEVKVRNRQGITD